MANPITIWTGPAGTPQTDAPVRLANPLAVETVVSGAPVSPTNPLPVTSDGGVAVANIQSGNGSIPATATTISLSPACSSFSIWTTSTGANLFVQLNGSAATTGAGNVEIFPGGALNYSGQSLSSVSIIGASASGTYSYEAN